MPKPTSKLAKAVASLKKTAIGADLAKPKTIRMPAAVSEIHVSADELIPPGTIITDEIAELAELDADTLDALEEGGHVKFVEVYATALPGTDG